MKKLCECGCGELAPIAALTNTKRGHVKGQPCRFVAGHQSRVLRNGVKHGLSHTPEWSAMWKARNRCTNPKDRAYGRYGGRGIEFRFESVEKAAAEILLVLGPRPSTKHSIDRRDNNSHYEIGNLQWATRSQQQINKRPGRKWKVSSSTFHGVTRGKSCNKWEAYVYLNRNPNRKRIYLGKFVNEIDAAKARDIFVVEHQLNFPLNFPVRRTIHKFKRAIPAEAPALHEVRA